MQTETVYYNSPIGVLEITSSNEKIAAIYFINSAKGPVIEEAGIVFTAPVSPVIQQCIAELGEYFEGKRKQFSFPIEQTGTGFQQEVWNELLNIPYGRTISYMELSKRLGNVKAIRAVGTANGNNSINIVVPCHRVIGSNGDLTGYGGDLWRKQWLLEHEAKMENGLQLLF